MQITFTRLYVRNLGGCDFFFRNAKENAEQRKKVLGWLGCF